MKKLFKYLMIFSIVYLAVCLVCFPGKALAVGSSAVRLCLSSVIPALLPYLICSGYISASGAASMLSRYLSPIMRPLFKVPGSGAIAFVLGMVSGYPIGAVCARDLYLSGECSKTEAERLLGFCNNSGPLFIMSVIGCDFLSSPYLGRLLYISHILSAALVGILLRSYGHSGSSPQRYLPPSISAKAKNPLQIFGEVVDSATYTILKICGFVIFFTVLATAIPQSGYTPFIHALLEITGGIRAIASANIDYSLRLPLISLFVAISGVSVLMQVGAITEASGLSLKPYIIGKLLQGGFSFVITKILISRLGPTVDVFTTKNAAEVVIPSSYSVLYSSLLMLSFGIVALLVITLIARLYQRLRP